MPFLKPVWEMSCYSKDIVLASSFEREELIRLVSRTEEGVAWRSGRTQEEAACGVVHFLHMQCHEETPLALELQRELAQRHRRALERFEALPIEEARILCLDKPLGEIEDLASLVWAVTADTRAGFEELSHAFLYRVLSESIRTAVFGSREAFLLQTELEATREKLRGTP